VSLPARFAPTAPLHPKKRSPDQEARSLTTSTEQTPSDKTPFLPTTRIRVARDPRLDNSRLASPSQSRVQSTATRSSSQSSTGHQRLCQSRHQTWPIIRQCIPIGYEVDTVAGSLPTTDSESTLRDNIWRLLEDGGMVNLSDMSRKVGRALRQWWNFFLLPQSAAATALRTMNLAMNIQILLPVLLTLRSLR
jgi:hypothetical protein